MKRNHNDIRTTAVLAAVAAGVTLWTSAALASETRPADFETEFEIELDLPAPPQAAVEAADDAAAEDAEDFEAFIAALVARPVTEEWECCVPVELVASEATMEGWAQAVSDYLDGYVASTTAAEAVAGEATAVDAFAAEDAAELVVALATAQHVSAASTTCEFCAELLAEQEDERQAEEGEAGAVASHVGWHVLREWTIARFAGVSRTTNEIEAVPASDGGDTCFRLILGDERQSSAE